MSYVLANVATQDGYSAQATLECPGTKRLRITVSNAAVVWQLGDGYLPSNWRQEQHDVPFIGSLERNCDAVRFRSAAPGTPARISVEALTEGELGV